MREVAAECRSPVMLYSIGKDSSVMLHLAIKAFYPARPPFPLLHVDTGWKFREMIEFRDATVARLGLKLLVHSNAEAQAQGINPFDHGGYYTHAMKTEALKQALTLHGFDAAFGGARRDEEKSRAKERIFSFRTASHEWDPKNQRPEFWRLYNGRVNAGESVRVFPLSNWTELDIWHYILQENLCRRAAVFRQAASDCRARRHDPDGGRRAHALRTRRGCASADDPLPLARLLAAIRRRALDGGDVARTGGRDAGVAGVRAWWAADRSRRRRQHGKEEARGLFLMPPPIAETITTLRFLTCGSVDDGKSTLIGRLLHESGFILDDQRATLERDSARHGTTGDDIDYALLVDGLEAERTQGITIDVAYRYFATARRRFVVADTPGHAQYTRNMATGAANAELAVLLVDARQGILTQTRRHAFLVSLMGIRHVVLAVNKMDLVEFDAGVFAEISMAFADAVEGLGFVDITAIPISARYGDNVTTGSANTPWYSGPSLLDHLESVTIVPSGSASFRMPVQWVNRANAAFRGYAGTIASGRIAPGDSAGPARSPGLQARIARIVTMDGDLPHAVAGDAVTLEMDQPIDLSRGDVLQSGEPVTVSDRFDADIVWLNEAPLFPGRGYLVKLGTATVAGSITRIRHRIDIESFEHVPADTLAINDVGRVTVALGAPLAIECYAENRDLGGFVLVDRRSNATVAVGMVRSIASSAGGVVWQAIEVDKKARAAVKDQRPAAVWFTGLSGAGKSTIANLVERRLHALGRHTALLDGDNVRHGLNRDLGFSEADRVENIRRAAEAARLMVEAGLIVLVSFISPYRSDRDTARALFDAGEFIEVFVDTPVDECRRRDPKGLYKRADAGEIRNFTGVTAPYEAPDSPELRLQTEAASAEQLADRVVQELAARGFFEL